MTGTADWSLHFSTFSSMLLKKRFQETSRVPLTWLIVLFGCIARETFIQSDDQTPLHPRIALTIAAGIIVFCTISSSEWPAFCSRLTTASIGSATSTTN